MLSCSELSKKRSLVHKVLEMVLSSEFITHFFCISPRFIEIQPFLKFILELQDLFWNYFEFILELFEIYFGTIWNLFWNYLEFILELFGIYFRTTRSCGHHHRFCIRVGLQKRNFKKR